MIFKKKWDKQNNSVKLLLKKLKRHDTLVVAIAVVIALILCGGLIYISTPVVTANAKEEFVESEKEDKEHTKEQLDALRDYIGELDKSITESQEGLDSFYELTKETSEQNTVTEKVVELSGNLKEIHDTISSADKDIESLKELIDTNNGANNEKITKDFENISSQISKLEGDCSSAQSDSKSLMEELKKQVDSGDLKLSDELAEKYGNMISKLTELDKSLNKEITNYFDELTENTNNSFNELNANITNNFDIMNASSDENMNVIKEFISGEMSTVNEKIDQVFQRVSNGKKLLASALLTKGMNVPEDATFEQYSEAIRNIPQQIVLGNGDVAGKVEYEYHYHVDGAGNECDERYVPTARKGGCYNEPFYHRHNDSCYTVTYAYVYTTSRDVDTIRDSFESNGQLFRRLRCNHCGYTWDGTNEAHEETTSNPATISSRGGRLVRTETHKKLICPYQEGQLLGYQTSCGYVHGQVVKAHITFGHEYEDYNSTVDVPRGNSSVVVQTSHVALQESSIDLSRLMMELEGSLDTALENGTSAEENVKTSGGESDGGTSEAASSTSSINIENKSEESTSEASSHEVSTSESSNEMINDSATTDEASIENIAITENVDLEDKETAEADENEVPEAASTVE